MERSLVSFKSSEQMFFALRKIALQTDRMPGSVARLILEAQLARYNQSPDDVLRLVRGEKEIRRGPGDGSRLKVPRVLTFKTSLTTAQTLEELAAKCSRRPGDVARVLILRQLEIHNFGTSALISVFEKPQTQQEGLWQEQPS
jgi:hypothetical protein